MNKKSCLPKNELESIEASFDAAGKSAFSGEDYFYSLDVRPVVKEGGEPFPLIMESLSELNSNALFYMTAPFKPSPLIDLLEERGFQVYTAELNKKLWEVVVWHTACRGPLDFSALEAPEPLERTLELISELKALEYRWVRLPRVPHLLFQRLSEEGLFYKHYEVENGSSFVLIKKP